MKGLILALLVAYAGWWLWQGPTDKRRKKPAPARPGVPPAASPAEADAALAILGLRPGADEGEVRAAHRRLIQAVHPDHGGSTELTRRVNAARDVLLKR
ncbi:MAG: J domain-containing protein [Sphingomonas sp.]